MDASYFHKPWIERLLSTFDPQLVTSESQDSLIGQVISVEFTTDPADDVGIAGRGELHDNHLFVNAMFTEDAIQRFEEEECKDGCSGAEFGDLKNSIITLKKYHVIPHLADDDQKMRQLLLCVEYFTLCHFDALPRVNRQPLVCASQKKSVADNIRRLCSKRSESCPEPEAVSPDNTSGLSEPHLTQLLEEINKASQREKERKKTAPKRTFVFEITPSRHMADSNSDETDEDIQILCDALSQMERKLSIAQKLHHLLKNSSAFTVEEVPSDIHRGLMADFDYEDFEVPEDILKQLQTIEEWQPDYVKASSVPSNSSPADMNDMGGGSSLVEMRTDNKQPRESVSPNQTELEGMFLGIDDSMESIGVSTEEMLLADSQTEITPSCIKSVPSKTPVKKACEKGETSASQQHVTKTNDLESNIQIKRKRIPTSEDVDNPNKISRQKSPGEMNCRSSNNRYSELGASKILSPIFGSHRQPPLFCQYLQASKMIQNQNTDSDRCIRDSINLESAEGSVANAVASETVQDRVVDAGTVNLVAHNDWEPDLSCSDLFEQTEDKNSCRAEMIQAGESPACQSNNIDTIKNMQIVSAKKQTKTVHFEDSVCEDYHRLNQDKQDSASAKSAIRPSVTQQNKVMSTHGDESSVEILNTSTVFQPVDFYTTPQTVGGRSKCRPIAKLRSPQIPCSVQTPVNSLPSHQPRHLLTSLITSSQSSVSSSSHTVETEVDPIIEELSNIKLEEQIFEWCTSHFIDMRNLAQNQKSKKKVR